jgi:predicted nucleotidyltransferase
MVNQIDMLGGRHKSTVQFAVETVSRILGSNVECVILYGSCAMGDYSYSSDVDLLVVVKDLAFNTRLLRTTCTPDDYTLPDVDTHFITSQSYHNGDSTYLHIIRKEGIQLEHQNLL